MIKKPIVANHIFFLPLLLSAKSIPSLKSIYRNAKFVRPIYQKVIFISLKRIVIRKSSIYASTIL